MKTLFRLLFDPTPQDGGAPQGDAATPPPAPTGALPPAAETVVDSDAQPGDAAEIVRLKRALDESQKLVKDRELTIAQRDDEVLRLSTPPKPKPAPKAEKSEARAGWTFFE